MKNKIMFLLCAVLLIIGTTLKSNSIHAEDYSNWDLEGFVLKEDSEAENGVIIESYTGIIPENPKIPDEINGKIVTQIGENVFADKEMKGHLTLPDSVHEVASKSFLNNYITGLSAAGLKTIGYEAFASNDINNIDLPNVEKINTVAFYNNKIEHINLPSVKLIGYSAFNAEDHNNQRLNPVKSLNAINVETIEGFAFMSSEIKELNLPNVQVIGEYAFYDNEINKAYMPKLESVSEGTFMLNRLSNLQIPNIKEIGNKAFYGNELSELRIKELPELGTEVFHHNNVTHKKLFYFPLHIENHSQKNAFDHSNFLVINPNEKLREDFSNDLVLKEDQIFIFPPLSKNPFDALLTGMDMNEVEYYCVGSTIYFEPGVYNLHHDVETVYIIDHGYKGFDDLPTRNQIFSLNIKPEIFLYSYETELVSKLIYHANLMIDEQELNNEELFKLVHLVASNTDLENGIHLTIDNFDKKIKDTKLYEEVINVHGESTILKLIELIKKDTRTYELSTYLSPSNHDYNQTLVNQPLIRPGKPLNELIEIHGEKIWNGGPIDKPTITIQLLRNGSKIDELELENGQLEFFWNKLPKTDELGNIYEYSIDEVDVPVNYRKSIEGFSITNTYTEHPPTNDPDDPVKTPEEPPHTPDEQPVKTPKTADTDLPQLEKETSNVVPNTGIKDSYLGYLLIIFMSLVILKPNKSLKTFNK